VIGTEQDLVNFIGEAGTIQDEDVRDILRAFEARGLSQAKLISLLNAEESITDKTIKTAIAVVTDSDGGYVAYGDNDRTPQESFDVLKEEGWLPDPSLRKEIHTVVALLPKPDPHKFDEVVAHDASQTDT
jgi:hypothetical protein